jgi:phosphomannomutase
MPSYIFDVDGTLTPSRGKIDPEFEQMFCKFAETNKVYLVTGSDKAKTLEQVGEYVYARCEAVYQCNGNQKFVAEKKVRDTYVDFSSLHEDLEKVLEESEYEVRTGQHIENRGAMLNLSVVGRGATLDQRKEYARYDRETGERSKIAEYLSSRHSDYNFQVAGETGIDITLKGCGKEQILEDFDPTEKLYFFGDMIVPDGNDYNIAMKIQNEELGEFYLVRDWKDTMNILLFHYGLKGNNNV